MPPSGTPDSSLTACSVHCRRGLIPTAARNFSSKAALWATRWRSQTGASTAQDTEAHIEYSYALIACVELHEPNLRAMWVEGGVVVRARLYFVRPARDGQADWRVVDILRQNCRLDVDRDRPVAGIGEHLNDRGRGRAVVGAVRDL